MTSAAALPETPDPTHTDSNLETSEKWLNRHFTLVIAILLGLASVVTAWSSFLESTYDGDMATANTKAGVLAAEAESLYLEGNQQYASDSSLFDRLTELEVQSRSTDPAAAGVALESLEVLSFQSLTPEFEAAIEWADAENEADPEMFTHPQGSDEYNEALFGGYHEVKADADAQLALSKQYADVGGQLTLSTVLLAISLFLFGIAAILGVGRIRLVATGSAILIMVVATIITVGAVLTPIG